MTKMRLYVGDSHGNFDSFNGVVANAIDALEWEDIHITEIISVGDFGFWPRKGLRFFPGKSWIPVRFIDGNHEDFDSLKKTTFPNPDWQCVHIPRGTIENGVLFMGGASTVDKSRRKEGWDLFRDENISYEESMRVFKEIERVGPESIRVFCCHDTIHPMFAKHVRPDIIDDPDFNRVTLDSIFHQCPNVKTYVHGHHHKHLIYKNGDTTFISLGATHLANSSESSDFTECTIAIADDGKYFDWNS